MIAYTLPSDFFPTEIYSDENIPDPLKRPYYYEYIHYAHPITLTSTFKNEDVADFRTFKSIADHTKRLELE